MIDSLVDVRTTINRLRPFERLESGRRVLALATLAYLAQQAGQAGAWRDIRNRVAHGIKLNDIGMDLERLAEQLESRISALHGVFTDGLIADVLHAGAALPGFILLASSLIEKQEKADHRIFANLFDTVLVEMSQGAATGEIITSPGLARLMVDLSEIDSRMSVLDPSCGLGETLAQAARRSPNVNILGQEVPDVELFGQEVNALSVALARLRLYLLGARSEIRIGDALDPTAQAFTRRKFDRVICDPPIGVKIPKDQQEQLASRYGLRTRTLRSETLFLLHCLEAVAPNGRIVVLMPIGFLFRAADKEVRTRLLEQGQIEGVVSLPTGVVGWTELAFALVVLRGEPTRDAPITLVDGERLQVSTRRGAERLTEEQIASLTQSYRCGKATDMIAHPSVAELLARDANLRPQVWTTGTMKDREPELGELYRSARHAEKEAAEIASRLDGLSAMLRLMR